MRGATAWCPPSRPGRCPSVPTPCGCVRSSSTCRYVRRDGSTIWVQADVALLRDAAARPLHSLAIMQDITDRKRAETALRESEQRYRGVVEAQTDDGRGFEPAHAPRSGLGLVSMAERVRLMRGTLAIERAPGRGAQVRARVPIAPVG